MKGLHLPLKSRHLSNDFSVLARLLFLPSAFMLFTFWPPVPFLRSWHSSLRLPEVSAQHLGPGSLSPPALQEPHHTLLF